MLMKRGWSMINRCSLCKDNKELADHILIHCGRTKGVMDFAAIFFWTGVGVPRLSEKSASGTES